MSEGQPRGPERRRSVAERTLATRRVYDGQVVSLRVDDVELPSGRRSRREVVEHPGAVAILAWDGERLTLVRQWRHAAGRALLELPAGTLDPGEEALAAARRELLEETGLEAGSWEEGPAFFTAPGFCTEHLTIFLATHLRPGVRGETPGDEEIELERLDLAAAVAGIEDRSIRDAKSLVGVLWLSHRLRELG